MPRLVQNWFARLRSAYEKLVGPPWDLTMTGGSSPSGATASGLLGAYHQACTGPSGPSQVISSATDEKGRVVAELRRSVRMELPAHSMIASSPGASACPIRATARGPIPPNSTEVATNGSAMNSPFDTTPACGKPSIHSATAAWSASMTLYGGPPRIQGAEQQSYGSWWSAVTCDCLLYTSDAADEEDSVDLGGRR